MNWFDETSLRANPAEAVQAAMIRLRFRADVIAERKDAALVLRSNAAQWTVPDADGSLTALAETLQGSGLESVPMQSGGRFDLLGAGVRRQHLLGQLDSLGLIVRCAESAGEVIAVSRTLAPAVTQRPSRLANLDGQLTLSRFALTRRVGSVLVLECPLGAEEVEFIAGRAGEIVPALARPGSVAELTARCVSLQATEVDALLELINHAGALTEVDAARGSEEDRDESVRLWEFHDLLFHTRSRNGRHGGEVGGTYRFADTVSAPAAFSVRPGRKVGLERSSGSGSSAEQMLFTEVLAQRHSVRDFGEPTIDRATLGEFLHRSARVVEQFTVAVPTSHGEMPMDVAVRPYPGAGALYELEVYLVVNRCQNLDPGLYHYDAAEHELALIEAPTRPTRQLLAYAAQSIHRDLDSLQVLVILSARFARLAWKYESVAYALLLKDVGVVQQTMWLVATAMGLGACALGGGDADLFAAAADTNYFAETSVGEMLLGTRKATGPPTSDS